MDTSVIKKGDKFLFIGATTGTLEGNIDELRVDGEIANNAKRKDMITFTVSERVRINDKLYIIKPHRLQKEKIYQLHPYCRCGYAKLGENYQKPYHNV